MLLLRKQVRFIFFSAFKKRIIINGFYICFIIKLELSLNVSLNGEFGHRSVSEG